MDVDFWSFPEKRGPTPAKLRTREKVGGFFSPEAGQARRQWLNSIDDRIAEGLRYYLGPSGVDQKVTAAAQGGQMLMDGADFQDAYTAGGDLMQSRSIPEAAANFLEFAAPAAAVMIPGVSNRMLQGAGDMAEDAARFVVDEYGGVNLNGKPFYHGTPDGRDVRAAGGFSSDKPVFLSDSYGMAKTYADDTRAFDYQNAEPEVFKAMTAPQRVLDVDAGGADFRGIDLGAVRRGLSNAGISDAQIEEAISGVRVRDDGKIRTDDLAKISKALGFEATDISRVRDAYSNNAKSKPGTVRMMLDPSSISIEGITPTNALTPPSPAQQVADLLASGRAADVTDEMLAKLTPNDNAELFKLYQSGATGADMPMDAASRMARAEGMGFGAGTPLYHGGRSDITGVSKFEGTSEAGQGALFSTSSPRVANTYASPMSRNDVVGNNVTPLFARSGDYKEAGFTVPFPENGSQADMDNWLSRVDAFNRRLDPDGAKQAYFERQASAARSDGRPGAVIREVEDNRRAVGFVEPSDVYMTLDPTTIRSRFARFDPRLSHLANLSAAGAGVAVINGQDDLTPEEQFRRMWWAQQPQKGNSQ
jgi:hypothetical protein